jgi:hypothetical protein
MGAFDVLVGRWRGEGEIPLDPPMKLATETTIERLGEFIVIRSVGEPAEVPDTVSIVGGAPEGDPQPMHYFDDRGVKRMYLTVVDDGTWRIWRHPDEDPNGPEGPGFDQRFIGEISADGGRIQARWERRTGTTGDGWEVDFPIEYTRL